MKLQFEFSEVLIEGIKNYRAVAKTEIDGKPTQFNLQQLTPISEEFFTQKIKESL
jgi:hypothetical protein